MPHVGWNQLEGLRRSPLLEGVSAGRLLLLPTFLLRDGDGRGGSSGRRPSTAADSAPLSGAGTVAGIQFHPEKSQSLGLQRAFEFSLVMRVIPAIDLRKGSAVRLVRGEKGSETGYSSDPEAIAFRWESEGASMLHVVDLDAAFGEPAQRALVERIVRKVAIPVQVGGGRPDAPGFLECSRRRSRARRLRHRRRRGAGDRDAGARERRRQSRRWSGRQEWQGRGSWMDRGSGRESYRARAEVGGRAASRASSIPRSPATAS